MKRLTVLFVFLLTVFFSYTVIAQGMGPSRKSIEISYPKKIQKLVLDPLPAGTYSVGVGGYFPTLDSAFNKLSIDGIAGEVILELTDSLYIAPAGQFGFLLNGPIPGAGPSSRVIVQRALNLLPCIIQGDGQAVICLLNTSYVTIRSWDYMGRIRLNVHAIKNPAYSWNDAIEFVDNSDYNIVQNIVAYTEDTEWGAAISLGVSSTDSNIIHYNVLTQGAYGIYLSGYNGSIKPKDNILRANIVYAETDSLFWGIQSEYCQSTIIEDNEVSKIKRYSLGSLIAAGINSGADNNCIIRNNVVFNIQSDEIRGSTGILLSGDVGLTGNDNQVYNNMIFEIQSTSINTESRVTGIQMWYQNNPKIYYNSVHLSGSGTNQKGSDALYISHNCTNVELKNNIFVNTRDESQYYASAIYNYTATNLVSDYNDLYYDDTNNNNCLVRIGSTDYLTLADWQATGQDLNSITEMPNFVGPYLKISETIPTYLESRATPIAGIDTDFEWDPRNATTPDIGADEFDGIYIIPVELTSFTAATNGKEVILNWSTATELNNQLFEVQRSFEGSDFATVGFVNGKGTTTERQDYSYSDEVFTNGKYSYRLKQIDYLGSYEYSDVVEIDFRTFDSYLLEQNYPNPFNPTTTIGFGIQSKSNVKITIINAIGEEVAVILNEEKEAGYHQVEFNAAKLPSGVYFYQLKAGNYVDTKKMILVK